MMDYSVAIRTLGKAGDKYQRELDSLARQTIKPKHIFVYIPEGYSIPQETIGIEQYIRCQKGMISQRALSANDIDTPLCLFLDDDVYLPPDAVETLIKALLENGGDCIAADTFKNQDMSILEKTKAAITNWAIPRIDDKWAFKIGYTGTFSYNLNPKNDICLSQNAAGPCSLWKTDSFRKIHFEDEIWVDQLGFAYGDELLFYYKLFKNGGKLLVHYTSGILHLDAQSSRNVFKSNYKKFYIRSFMWFVIWWRTQYENCGNRMVDKLLTVSLFVIKLLFDVILHVIFGICHLSINPVIFWTKGLYNGFQFVHSHEYLEIRPFVCKQNQIG